jgi:hypothetical protein
MCRLGFHAAALLNPRLCTDSPFCAYDDPKRLYAIGRNCDTAESTLGLALRTGLSVRQDPVSSSLTMMKPRWRR